jgi:hypothetical protein
LQTIHLVNRSGTTNRVWLRPNLVPNLISGTARASTAKILEYLMSS